MAINGEVLRGPDAVRASLKELIEQNESIRFEANEVAHIPAGDGLIGIGTATSDLKPAVGSPQLIVERWSDLRRKIDGRWVYVLNHVTVLPEE